MKTYKVTITETLKMEVEIQADSIADAEEMISEKWNDGEYVLDADHFVGADFQAEPVQKQRSYER